MKKADQPVANADLWKALDQLDDNYAIRWINAKGQDLQGLKEAGHLAVDAVRLETGG